MSVETFYIGKDMKFPQIAATLQNPDGVAVNIQGKPVTFTMIAAPPSTAATVTGDALNLDDGSAELRGQVVYTWPGAQDTATVGRYRAFWKVEITAGQFERFPSNGDEYHVIKVEAP